jgi:hypothetical protein
VIQRGKGFIGLRVRCGLDSRLDIQSIDSLTDFIIRHAAEVDMSGTMAIDRFVKVVEAFDIDLSASEFGHDTVSL